MDFIVNIFVLSVINISCEMKYIKMKICVVVIKLQHCGT